MTHSVAFAVTAHGDAWRLPQSIIPQALELGRFETGFCMLRKEVAVVDGRMQPGGGPWPLFWLGRRFDQAWPGRRRRRLALTRAASLPRAGIMPMPSIGEKAMLQKSFSFAAVGGAVCRLMNKDRAKTGIRCSVESTGGSVFQCQCHQVGRT
jgi:hypothetical protein